jgi:hypothetical protein
LPSDFALLQLVFGKIVNNQICGIGESLDAFGDFAEVSGLVEEGFWRAGDAGEGVDIEEGFVGGALDAFAFGGIVIRCIQRALLCGVVFYFLCVLGKIVLYLLCGLSGDIRA